MDDEKGTEGMAPRGVPQTHSRTRLAAISSRVICCARQKTRTTRYVIFYI